MQGDGKRDPRPLDSPGRLRQVEAGKRNAGNLKPFKPGETGNREGKNGSKWTTQFREFFDESPQPGEASRFINVLHALYLKALKGSELAQSTIVNHMKGKPKETVEVESNITVEDDRTKIPLFAMLENSIRKARKAEEEAQDAGMVSEDGESPKSGS